MAHITVRTCICLCHLFLSCPQKCASLPRASSPAIQDPLETQRNNVMVALQLKQSTTCNSRARDSEIGSTSGHSTPGLSHKELHPLLSPCSYGLPTGDAQPNCPDGRPKGLAREVKADDSNQGYDHDDLTEVNFFLAHNLTGLKQEVNTLQLQITETHKELMHAKSLTSSCNHLLHGCPNDR
ncbi:hypothetical protein DPX16_21125 [Anabarilius grahami]|uniref:Uncharacterized protein n=1 Tax=Anabarilius grahami TaxID=495550 RepID=A0A3N0XTJ7_ANAGA|nr:hypothetical protein DPX16_21125 [Anabarilius grahami]